jgi:uncharacterized protein
MDIGSIIILIAAGAVAGFAGGMLGLGGAFLMTPFQVIVYTRMGLSPDLAVKIAFGTSLLVVFTTSISGAWRHSRHGAVNFKVAGVMGFTGLIFSYIGSTLAAHIDGSILKIVFGAIAFTTVIRMLLDLKEKADTVTVSKPWVWALWAVPVGLLSGLLGVGGGVLLVPIMVVVLKFHIKDAAATSLAAIFITSIGGIIGYIINGLDVAGRPDFSLGYIDLRAWILLAVPAAIMAQVGAVAAHRISRKWLTWIFVAVLLYTGLHMIGVFEWLGWSL